MWLAIEKDHRRFYPQYTAASQTGPYMAHIEGERATTAIPAHAVAKLADWRHDFGPIENSTPNSSTPQLFAILSLFDLFKNAKMPSIVSCSLS
jgi:hypothetical protein